MNKSDLMYYSLVNMYKELESDIEGFQHPGHGDLTGWAKQGDISTSCLTASTYVSVTHVYLTQSHQ